MTPKSSETVYPRVLRLIHWTVAVLVLCQFAVAMALTQLRSAEYGQLVLNAHRQLGVVILLLVVVRVVMHRWHRVPAFKSSAFPAWQVRSAAAVHVALTALLIVQPVVGIFIAWARGDSVGLFGLVNITAPIDISDAARERLMSVHIVLAVAMLGLCAVHVGAVVFNRFVRRVSVLERMLPPVANDQLANRVQVGIQLILAFGLVIGAAVTMGVNAVVTYRHLTRTTAATAAADGAVADDLRTAQLTWKDYRVALDAGAAGQARLAKLADAVHSVLLDAQAHALDRDVRAALGEAVVKVSAAAGGGVAAVMAVDGRLQDLVDAQSMVLVQHRADNDDLAARGHDLIVVTLLPMVLAGLMAAVVLARSVTSSLSRMAALIKSIEADRRDVQFRVQGSGEFAGLARNIISMREAIERRANAAAARQAELEAERARLAAEQLRREHELERQQQTVRRAQREQLASEFEQQITGIIGTVSDAAQTLTSMAATMARSASTSTQRSRDATSVAERTSQHAADVEAGTGELSATAQFVRENAEASKSRAGQAVQEAAAANEQIGSLVAAVRQISTITDLIATVARQTSLLAINARIEAARAGEVGQGFSVVADEVKALARQTGEATSGIEKQIQQINAAAARSLDSLHRLQDVIAGVDEAASAIFAVIDEQVASTRRIAGRMSQISSSTRSVATDILDAQETAHATERMSSDVLRAAGLIGDQTDRLRAQVDRFVEGLRAAGVQARPGASGDTSTLKAAG